MHREYRLGKASFIEAGDELSVTSNLALGITERPAHHDLDLTYVECRFCGKPVLWPQGKTRLLLLASGIDLALLDEECLILSEGCPACQPGAGVFHLHVVRVASFATQELLLLHSEHGTA